MQPSDVLAVAAAPFAGSFLGVLIARYPAWRGAATGRSQCPACGHRLGWRDLVPLLSYALSKGRCRHCGAPIGRFYPLLELAALAAALWAATVFSGVLLWATCGLGWSLLALAVIDWRHRQLPDALTLPLVLAGLALAYLDAPEELPDRALGAAIGYGTFAAIAWGYRRLRGRDGLGMGDAKLLAGGGAWLAWWGLPSVVLIAALAGLAWSLARAAAARRSPAWGEAIPFGPFLAAGFWLVWLYGPLILAV
jgi:leader peptidase (prepilin peptidase) / N-methyltransferase